MEQTLGKRILQNRKRLGLTQDQLAERLGVTAQAISKWENDQSCPDITMLPRLAEIFGISTDELLGVAPSVHSGELVAESGSSLCQTPGVEAKAGGWEMHWDGGSRANIALAIWLLLSGAVLLASNLMGWSGDLWGILWPSWLVVYGAFGFSTWKFSFLRMLSLLAGLYFLLNNLRPDLFTLPGTFYLPILLIILGVGLILDAQRTKRKPSFHFKLKGNPDVKSSPAASLTQTEDSFTYTGSFFDDKETVYLPLLNSGNVEVSFGNLNLDLTGCEAFGEDCRLDIACSFGEVNLLLPCTCRVKADSDTAFGNLEISGECAPDAPYTIALNCGICFGNVTVRYI